MRRRERTRVERVRRIALLTGLSFALGALADSALTWRLHEFDPAHEPARGGPTVAAGVLEHGAPVIAADRAAARPAATTGTVVRPLDNPALVSAVVTELRDRDLTVPVRGVDRHDLRDSYADQRSGHTHEALDIMAARGTPVIAVESGRIAKLFNSKAGGLTIYQFDPSETYAYYYAHLDGYEPGLREGQDIKRGDVLGYVGSTGNAAENAPHLHFAIFRLGPDRKWWHGDAIDPYPILSR